jgi:taurine dioxygenase
MQIKHLSGALGAEVSDIDLSTPLDDATLHSLRSAWLEHHVLVFRDQALSPAQHAAFCAQLGELDTYPFVEATTEHPNVIPIIKEPDQKINFGGGWHTDTSYMQCPPMATCLHAVEVPERGGDTLFADTNKAFEALTPGMQAWIEPLIGIFTPAMVHGKSGAYAKVQHGMAKKQNEDTAEQRIEHPIIRTHPETGRKAIYAGTAHCERFKGMTREESLPMLKFLQDQATRPEFTSRVTWQPHTITLWDNRCVFHYALNDYQGERRHMERVTIKGDAPA